MSKVYQPGTEYYRELLAACREELLLLGYAKGTAEVGWRRRVLATDGSNR